MSDQLHDRSCYQGKSRQHTQGAARAAAAAGAVGCFSAFLDELLFAVGADFHAPLPRGFSRLEEIDGTGLLGS